jgi:hypothetical protein
MVASSDAGIAFAWSVMVSTTSAASAATRSGDACGVRAHRQIPSAVRTLFA